MIDTGLASQVTALSARDRLELLSLVWDGFEPDDAPVTEEERQLLTARLADLAEHPHDQAPAAEVIARLRRHRS